MFLNKLKTPRLCYDPRHPPVSCVELERGIDSDRCKMQTAYRSMTRGFVLYTGFRPKFRRERPQSENRSDVWRILCDIPPVTT